MMHSAHKYKVNAYIKFAQPNVKGIERFSIILNILGPASS